MAHRVLYLNSIVTLCLWQVGCTNSFPKENAAVIPAVYVQMNDAHLKHDGGNLYYNDTPFAGWTFQLYPGGDTAQLTPYFNGKENGWSKKWHPNKQLSEQRFFVAGRKEDVHTAWWEDGSIKFEYHFLNDEHEGEAKEWFRNGKMFRFFHYKTGHEDGRQQMWWDDGKVRANYIVRNGEQYGLIGRKLCKNTQ